MTEVVIFITTLVAAALALTIMMRAALSRRHDEFDGGYEHDNQVRITKVRGNYIINEGDKE